MKTIILTSLLIIAGCDQPKSPDVASHPDPELQPPTVACTLYQKNATDLTMKVAVVEPELVGGSPGERMKSTVNDPAHYTAFWSCITYATANKSSWCECPRGPNREFEDSKTKDKSPIVWIDK